MRRRLVHIVQQDCLYDMWIEKGYLDCFEACDFTRVSQSHCGVSTIYIMACVLTIYLNPSNSSLSCSYSFSLVQSSFDLKIANKPFHYPDPRFHPSIHFVPVAQTPLSTFGLSAFPCRIITSLFLLTGGRLPPISRTNLTSTTGISSSFFNRSSLACAQSAHTVSTLRV
jgi:hypothetical protein